MLLPVDDPADPRLADYLDLRDADLRRRGDAFVCEGILPLRRALAQRWPLRSVLLAERRAEAFVDELVDVPTYVATQAVLDHVVGFALHRGVVAIAERRPNPDLDDLLATAATVVVLEGVNDAENLGAIYRNAAAFGAGAVLLDPTTADPFNRRTVRVSLGHVLAVPTARLPVWPPELDRPVIALTPAPGTEPVSVLDDLDRVALLLGAEGPGLSDAALAAADRRVRIPLAAGVDSLNVATALAIGLHHRFRG